MRHQLWALFMVLTSCILPKTEEKPLPILGHTLYEGKDTLYHTIQDFKLMDQDSIWVSSASTADKIYVADFFFTSCPTICPVMKSQMMRVYDRFASYPQFLILSHTIDPTYDTIPLLRDYAERLGVGGSNWRFLWGDQEEIYELAEQSYLSIADEDASAPGGYVHSGAFLLVDKARRIRGVYDGTVPEQVDLLIKDIEKLLATYE